MIILIQINHSADHSEKILPLGILSVGSALKRAGLAVELINITEKEIDQTALRDFPKAVSCLFFRHDGPSDQAQRADEQEA